MVSIAADMTPRRAYWLSMAALVVAVPAALIAQSWGDAQAWRSAHERHPIPATAGQAVDYGGARWTVTRFTRLATSDAKRAVLLAEFEAVAGNPKALSETPCQVILTDGADRKWRPVLFADPVVRKLYPETSERSLCGGPAFGRAEPGKPVRMVETFDIPADARDLKLSIALFSVLPDYLNVSEPNL